jgi:hypothetical protein
MARSVLPATRRPGAGHTVSLHERPCPRCSRLQMPGKIGSPLFEQDMARHTGPCEGQVPMMTSPCRGPPHTRVVARRVPAILGHPIEQEPERVIVRGPRPVDETPAWSATSAPGALEKQDAGFPLHEITMAPSKKADQPSPHAALATMVVVN